MELWVAFGFGAAVGALVGYLLGRRKQVPLAVARPAPPSQPPPSSKPSTPSNVKHVLLDEGSANVLNALNNRLAAIGALADLLHGSPLDPERARALVLLHGEVRRAAETASHFLELAAHPAGAAEPCDAAVVFNGVLAERESTFRELGVKLMRSVPADLPMVACPMAQLTEMLTKLLDFSLRRLRASQPPRGGSTGAEVVVTLPRSLLGAQTATAVQAESLPRMRILVVDDDAVNRQAMLLPLEREGQQVVAVENGLEAMERLGERDTFDAIVTDLQMPRLGGRAMYEQLVTSRPLVAKRFVFVTGDQARGETRSFLENCGQPSVTKPYDLGDLINAIGTVSRKK